MDKPKISVLTSVYKGEEFIKAAADSVLNQTYANFEWIIINDASPDNSIKILESYNNPRIKIYHNESNIGLAASLNKGWELCQGEYIARMDTDDVCRLDRFEKQLAFMESNHDISVVGSWVNLTGDWSGIWKTPVTHEEIKCKLLFNSAMAHPTVFIRKKDFDDNRFRYSEVLRKIQDYDLWSRAIQQLKFANIPEVLLDYRIDIGAKSAEVVKKSNETIYAIRANQLNNLGITLSSEEADTLHFASANQLEKVNAKVLKKVFANIIKANQTKSIYSSRYLSKFIGRMWIRLWLKQPLVVFKSNFLLLSTSFKSLFS
jgi:glycosyltransferase involved in cell wall biosynthesis